MIAKAKRSILAASLACVAVGTALCVTVGVHSASANEDDRKPCDNRVVISTETAQHVIEDLESLIDDNKKFFNIDWAATSIEYIADIRILKCGDNGSDIMGVYVDLDGDNGYFILTEVGYKEYNTYSAYTHGDLDFLRGATNLTFFPRDGFTYKGSDGVRYEYLQRRDYSDDMYC